MHALSKNIYRLFTQLLPVSGVVGVVFHLFVCMCIVCCAASWFPAQRPHACPSALLTQCLTQQSPSSRCKSDFTYGIFRNFSLLRVCMGFYSFQVFILIPIMSNVSDYKVICLSSLLSWARERYWTWMWWRHPLWHDGVREETLYAPFVNLLIEGRDW